MERPKIVLEVEMQADAIRVRLSNKGASSFAMWRFNNSWGWGSLHFEVLDLTQDSQPIVFLIQPQDRVFTRNGPGIQIIEPNGHHSEDFTLTQTDWRIGPVGEGLAPAATKFGLRAVWNQKSKAEGAALGVQDCQAISETITLTTVQWVAIQNLQESKD